ncbi:MAG: DUF4363 family protein [Eubacteriales bacterium]
MKAVVTALVLFLIVISFLGVNYFVLNNFFERTDQALALLPTAADELENMTEAELVTISERLEHIRGDWETYQTYICLSLEHTVSREFFTDFLPAIAYFDAGEYPDFLAQIKKAKDTLEHLIFDESLRLGNVL